ncbi:MAG: protein phosphatase 2C domain-containing protein [Gemmataceae bacterium]|nr:protein phosphatase 2C domain-containing protein [Gemmataceae bacterium]MDW8266174.1 protein phosphatase 2C domain-containing protein [Gemmataceae bacterium]
MALQVSCPGCQTVCLVAEELIGTAVYCSECGMAFTVRPEPAPTPAPAVEAPPAGAGIARLEIGWATSRGRVRDRNEDSFLVQHHCWCNRDLRQEVALIVVADGMGSYGNGEKASGMVIRNLGQELLPLLNAVLLMESPDPAALNLGGKLLSAVREVNRLVYEHATRGDPNCRGMGATAEVVVVWNGRVWITHVGDCRVYHLRGDRLAQITEDQTLVARMVALGQLSPREARTHPVRNEVTQGIGKRSDIEPNSYELVLTPRDWLVIACDGLHAHVDEGQLLETVRKAPPVAPFVAQRLVQLADQGGGSDNCTVVAVRAY